MSTVGDKTKAERQRIGMSEIRRKVYAAGELIQPPNSPSSGTPEGSQRTIVPPQSSSAIQAANSVGSQRNQQHSAAKEALSEYLVFHPSSNDKQIHAPRQAAIAKIADYQRKQQFTAAQESLSEYLVFRSSLNASKLNVPKQAANKAGAQRNKKLAAAKRNWQRQLKHLNTKPLSKLQAASPILSGLLRSPIKVSKISTENSTIGHSTVSSSDEPAEKRRRTLPCLLRVKPPALDWGMFINAPKNDESDTCTQRTATETSCSPTSTTTTSKPIGKRDVMLTFNPEETDHVSVLPQVDLRLNFMKITQKLLKEETPDENPNIIDLTMSESPSQSPMSIDSDEDVSWIPPVDVEEDFPMTPSPVHDTDIEFRTVEENANRSFQYQFNIIPCPLANCFLFGPRRSLNNHYISAHANKDIKDERFFCFVFPS